jgi:hypothetical protein
MADVRTLEPNEANTSYSHIGKDFGNPMLNMMMGMMFGENLMPSRDDGQSMYDSLIQRQRSQHFMQLQRSGAANNMLFKSMGINENPMARSMSAMAMSSPDSAMGKLMSPMLGGNPMAASMRLYGGLAGGNIMGNFGRLSSLSVGETEDTMEALMGNVYKTQDYEGPGGVREELNTKTQKRLLALSGDKKNDDYLKNMGINVERTSSGELTESSRKRLENFEIAGGSEASKQVKQVRQEKTAAINNDLASLLNSADKEMSAILDDRVEKQLKAHGIATAEQIKSAKNSGDKATYASKIREYLDKYEVSGGDAGTSEAKQARKDIVSSLQPELQTLAEVQETVKKQEVPAARADNFEKKLISQGIASKEELKAARQGGTAAYTAQVQEMLSKYEASGGNVASPEARQARKDAIAKLQPELQELAPAIKTQEASDKLESKLRDSGALTPSQIKEIKTEGKIDTKKATEILKKYEEGGLEPTDTESADVRNTRNRIASKRTLASKISSDLEEVQALDDKDETKESRIKALKKSLTENIGVTSKEADQIFDEDRGFFETKGVSSKGASKARKAIKNYAALDEVEQAYEDSVGAKESGKKYKGFNFENTRGFKVEDFTSAYVQASNLRGLGESRGVSVAGKMADFSKNAGGTLDAARSLFGNKSGGELVGNISDMMGSDFDLSSREGNDTAEKLLRDVKATADVAGTSIKTMLGIIDATKELAANNPRLATVSAQTTTKMAMAAVAKSADIGSAMSAKDYRQAGGSQGIASDEVASTQAFMSSGLGQQIAGIASITKGLGTMTDKDGKTYDPHEKFLEMIRKGELTSDDFSSGKAQEKIEQITQGKVNAATIARVGTDPRAAALGMEDQATSQALAEAKNATVDVDFWKGAEMRGFKKKDYYKRVAEEKAKGKTGKSAKEVFDSMSSDAFAGDTQAQEMAKTYGGTVQRGAVDAARTPEERARFEKLKEARSAADARISKVYAANQSPVAQQLLGAIMEGKSFGDTADIMGGIFATKDYKKQGNREAVEKAKNAGQKITDISAKAEGSQLDIMKLGMGKALNEFIGGRKAEAAERGENVDYLKTNIKDEDFEQEAKMLKHVAKTGSAREAQRTLNDLEAQSKAGVLPEDMNDSLKALRTAKAAGHLDSDAALKLAKTGNLEGVAAATVEAQKSANMERMQKEEKANSLKGLGERLQTEAGSAEGGESRKALDFYSKQLGKSSTDPAVMQKLFEDWQNPTKGPKGSNFFADPVTGERRKDLDSSSLGISLKETQDQISQSEQTLKEGTGKAGDNANQPLIKALEGLLKGINEGGGIGKALDGLATALQGVR